MNWKTTLIERRVAGTPGNCRVAYTMQDNERVRFFILYGAKIRFTRSYATIADGMANVVNDYRESAA